MNIHLVGSQTIRGLNRQWRGKDKETDVLSFPLGVEVEGPSSFLLGELMISVPQALRQSAQLGHGLSRELEILAVHGLLHLLGFDHERGPKEAALMARWERRLLGPRGLIERTISLP